MTLRRWLSGEGIHTVLGMTELDTPIFLSPTYG